MATIDEIVARTGASKRKVTNVAKSMGFEPANEYPDEVEACVITKMRSAPRKAKKRPPAPANDAAKAETSISNSNQIEQDRIQMDARAQEKAAKRIIAENERIAYYLRTENFTNPKLKEQVEHSKKLLSNSIKQQYSIDTYLSHLIPKEARNKFGLEQWFKSSKTQPDKLDTDESSD